MVAFFKQCKCHRKTLSVQIAIMWNRSTPVTVENIGFLRWWQTIWGAMFIKSDVKADQCMAEQTGGEKWSLWQQEMIASKLESQIFPDNQLLSAVGQEVFRSFTRVEAAVPWGKNAPLQEVSSSSTPVGHGNLQMEKNKKKEKEKRNYPSPHEQALCRRMTCNS